MRSRTLAALLALFGGVFGLHYFYLGRTGLGIMSTVFTFTGGLAPVSVIIGVVNFFILLGMSDEEFNKRYNREYWRDEKRRRYESESFDDEERKRRAYSEARQRMNPTPVREKQKETYQRPTTSQKEPLKQSGLAKYKDFDYDGAIEDFGKALSIDNKDVAIHWNLSCLYSLTEQKELSFFHLQKAIELGFSDYDKIKTHEALSHLRVQPEFEEFARAGFRMTESMEHSNILQEIKRMSEQREKGLISEKEFAEMSKRLQY